MMFGGRFLRSASTVVLLLSVCFASSSARARDNRRRGRTSYTSDDVDLTKLTVPELIRYHGYPVEVHHVVSEDGYIIELHRIPPMNRTLNSYEDAGDDESSKRVAILPHCFMCNSASWVVIGSGKAIPYILNENGYDIWMINARGSSYGRNHTSLSQRDNKFWKFSIHEMGVYDMSATVDYVLRMTNAPKVDAIGYSMGLAQLYILLSERPEYNAKFNKIVSLAASVFIGDTRGMMGNMAQYPNLITDFFVGTNQLMIPPRDWNVNEMMMSWCRPGNSIMESMCDSSITMFTATDGGRPIRNQMPLFFHHFPDTTSLRVMAHLGQFILTNKFRKFDFGPRLNRRKYNGSSSPPSYNLQKVRTKIYMIYSEGDTITGPGGMKKLRRTLPNVKEFYRIPRKTFTHWDYTWAVDAYKLVNLKVLEMLIS